MLKQKNGLAVLKFTKATDKEEDKTHGVKEFVLYMAIRYRAFLGSDGNQNAQSLTEHHECVPRM